MAKENTPATQAASAADSAAQSPQPVRADITLRPIEGSDRPALSNLTSVQTVMDMVIVDFGFLEPQTVNAIAQAGRAGTQLPNPLAGQLASRVAMSPQTANQLAQQLNELLNRMRQQAASAPQTAGAPVKKP